MASKGQKFVRFSDKERTEIVGKYMSGKYGYKTLAKEYDISWKAVKDQWLENIAKMVQQYLIKKVDQKQEI